VRANDRRGPEGNLSEKRRQKLAPGVPQQTPELSTLITGNAGQRRFDVTPDALDPTHRRVSVIVSRPIRLREGAAPIRRVLIFDNHPATIRLLEELDRAQKGKGRLTLVKYGALIVLLLLAMLWPLL
jgi:hypothetical protein